MPKRFIDTERNRKSMRGVDVKLRFAFEWLWQNCDAAGIWDWDPDLFRFECGYKLDIEALMKACPRVGRLPDGAVILLDFVEINYGKLKEGYNPHKPAFRSLEAHNVKSSDGQLQDLPKTCPSLEEEEEEEEEDTGKGVQGEGAEKFEVFWDLYGKKVGRVKAEQKWHKLKPEEQEQVLEHVPAYVSSTPEVKFRKDPSTYLNGRCWEDEIINRTDERPRHQPATGVWNANR